jgi:DNA-binding transcriptional MerR regulator
MKRIIYNPNEFIKKINASFEELGTWEKMGMMQPSGRIDDKIPYYTEENVEQAKQIRKLSEMGYALSDIRKILKKIGLPNKEINTKGEGSKFLTVGELASQANINTRTIKYWEERGIISPDQRSSGGFRLYSQDYVYLCKLILDLQNFGYSLENIKEVSDLIRDFFALKSDLSETTPDKAVERLETMEHRILDLYARMNTLKEGIQRWDELLKKKRKEITQLKEKAAADSAQKKNAKQSKPESTAKNS